MQPREKNLMHQQEENEAGTRRGVTLQNAEQVPAGEDHCSRNAALATGWREGRACVNLIWSVSKTVDAFYPQV